MRAILDTNVLLSGLLWRGPPHALVAHARSGDLTLVSSPSLVAELARVLERTKFDAILARTETTRERTIAEVQQLADLIDPPPLDAPACRDPDDDALLALAVAAHVDLIVSGDDDLLAMQSYAGIPILDPAQGLQWVRDRL